MLQCGTTGRGSCWNLKTGGRSWTDIKATTADKSYTAKAAVSASGHYLSDLPDRGRGQRPFPSACFEQKGLSINPTMANVPCTPHRAPADGPTDMTPRGSGHADTINSYPTSAACHTDLRGHALRLMERRDRHGLHRCCEHQCKSNSDHPNHGFFSDVTLKKRFLEECKITQPSCVRSI